MRALVVFVVVLMLSMLPRIAPAQAPSAEAEAHFKRGVTLYQEADFKAALVEFKRAYELSKNWRLLYNVARAENQAYDYAAALASFETYLREGGDRVPKARRVEVEQDLAKLRARVGKLTVRANVPDAIVAIDDEVLGKAPITHAVTVGSRRITVKKEGYAPWSQSVEIAGGDDRTVEAVLEAPSVAIASPAPAPPPPAPPPAKRFPWEAWTVTGVLTAAAVTTGIVALDAASSLDSAKGRFDVTDAELHDASKKVKTFGLVTDILAIGAIGSGVFSLYLTLKSPAAAPAIRVSPWPGGLSASGRF